MPTETEIKLTLPSRERGNIMGLPCIERLAEGPAKSKRLVSVYYDTPDCLLRKHRTLLRLRHEGAHWIQTVKTEGLVRNGLHRRSEWETEVPGQRLVFDQLPNNPELDWLRETALHQRLAPRFTTDFLRTSRMLRDGATTMELAVDFGEVRAGDRRTPLCEIEIELKQGDAACLDQVAHCIQGAVAARPENISKAERGYHLAAC